MVFHRYLRIDLQNLLEVKRKDYSDLFSTVEHEIASGRVPHATLDELRCRLNNINPRLCSWLIWPIVVKFHHGEISESLSAGRGNPSINNLTRQDGRFIVTIL